MDLILILIILISVFWFYRNRKAASGAQLKTDDMRTSLPTPPDLSMIPNQFIVFDLETTGLHSNRHEIIEIAAIRANRDSDLHDTFTTLVMPRGRISAKITELTGINRKMIKADGLPLDEALSDFRDFVSDLPMIAFNAQFDVAFLKSACNQIGQPQFTNISHCALKLARKAWPERKSYKLSSICSDAGIALNSEHRALPDCERALRVFVAAAQALGSIE